MKDFLIRILSRNRIFDEKAFLKREKDYDMIWSLGRCWSLNVGKIYVGLIWEKEINKNYVARQTF